ncbi:rhamnan synthesis F family protein [Paragemmobacter ruber]|uniref:Rhamnan synthesis protein F n=1 Tax=Paragemmobacter ruber TaxID=1985673 RepID=A0ABW9Y9F0_9RHOB|nr:rhamnan synthesis F family protein [Rhodobacter ruber]NBE08651.1 hypothetical protein [Rhodobacter ruber]
MNGINAAISGESPLTDRGRADRGDRSQGASGLSGEVEPLDVCAQAMEVLRSSEVAFEGKEVCLFVTFVAGNQLLPGPLALVKALVASGLSVVVCCAVNDMNVTIDLTGLDGAAHILKRENGGYDFAVWAAALARMPDLWSAKRLFFVNDSILGPLSGFDRTLERIRASDADFLALTESFEYRHHVQSYFFVLQNDGMSSEQVRTFWSEVKAEQTKIDVIQKYEIRLLEQMRETAHLKTEVLFSYDFLFPQMDWSSLKGKNPTLHLWEQLVTSGFPFVKVELINANPHNFDIAHWPRLVKRYGGDVEIFNQHIVMIRKTRGLPRQHPVGWRSRITLGRMIARAKGWARRWGV